MSEVVQGVPQPLQTVTDLAGEEGGAPGCACDAGSGGGASLAGVLVLALGVGLRRRRSAALLALAFPGVAAAQYKTDATPAWADFEFRYGTILYEDTNDINDVYGKSGHDQFTFEAGGQFYRFVEVDLGFGYNRDSTFVRGTDLVLSNEGTALAQYPLYLDVTGRLHILDEQFFVPIIRIGLDYVLWHEVVGNADGTRDGISGGKAGWHWGAGGQFLLDTLAPRRASLLEAAMGINDSWLTLEWRRQHVEPGQFLFLDNTDGLSFSGDLFQVGVKIDY